jgi:hypothetical protein
MSTLGWSDEFPFGKYRGMTVQEVASFNPRYLQWAVNNLENFDLTPEARKLGQRELNRHNEGVFQRQNGWAWGFGSQAKRAAEQQASRNIRNEIEAERARDARQVQREAKRA